MHRRLGRGLAFFALFALMACSGGSGCGAGCGVQPIPGGFPVGDRVPNSMQVRLTSSGLRTMENNASALIGSFLEDGLTFAIPRTSGSFTGGSYDLCTTGTGTCKVRGEISNIALTPQNSTSRLHGNVRAVLDSRNGSLGRAGVPTQICLGSACATCQVDIDTRPGLYPDVEVDADLELVSETRAARAGYTKLRVASFALGERNIEEADLDIGSCTGGGSWYETLFAVALETIADTLKGTVISIISGQLGSLLTDVINDQTCTKRGMYGCPTGTFSVPNTSDPENVCRYSADENADCVPLLLGTDGQGDLGAAFLRKVSPGTHGTGQFLLAAGGNGDMVNDGASLSFYGGFRSTDRTFTTSPGHATCVPVTTPPTIPTINRANAFRINNIPGTDTPVDVSIGLAEDFLNYAGWGFFDSGLLCISVGTSLAQQISTGLFSVFLQGLKDLAFPLENAPIAISLRPQKAPEFDVTTGNPLLRVKFPELAIDFYVWSSERYIRFMTFTADLKVDVNLSVVDGKLQPAVGNIAAENAVVTNSSLLTGDSATIAGVVQTILGTVGGMLMSAIPAIDLPEFAGFRIDVPSNGITGYSEGGDDFIAIFASLRPATTTTGSVTATPETSLRVSDLRVDPTSLALETFGQGQKTSVRLDFSAVAPAGQVEYSYRIDNQAWSPWSAHNTAVVEDSVLLLQARHVIEARSRYVGDDVSIDRTPAQQTVIVDILAPQVTLDIRSDGVRVDAFDIVSAKTAMSYRARFDGGAWSAWQPSAFFPTPYADQQRVEVEARDEAGNVGARSEALRGLPNPALASSSGCGCVVASNDPMSNASTVLGFVLVAMVIVSRRRRFSRNVALTSKVRAAIIVSSMPFVLGAVACDCGGDKGPGDMTSDACSPACSEALGGGSNSGSRCCESTMMCVSYDLDALCEGALVCNSASDVTFDSCTPACTNCVAPPALSEGILGTYLDMTTTSDGAIVFSGYAPGVPPLLRYGDLIVGTWDQAGSKVNWEIIDGIPSDGQLIGDPAGWRGGNGTPGDDVGRYSSIAAFGDDLFVSYYDVTHGALKLARRKGGTWSTQTVDDDGDCGRFSSIVVGSDGIPLIAYGCINAPETTGKPKGYALVARAKSTDPVTSDDWDLTYVHQGEIPCRAEYCNSGQVCSSATDECVASALPEDTRAAGFVEDLPITTGLYNAIATSADGTHVGVVYYDRSAGNLRGSAWDGSSWGTSFVIDGYARNDATSGDSGIGASLFITNDGTWYVSYVDGAEETLKLAIVNNGTVSQRRLVDDGTSNGSATNTDGRHIVGDDSSVVVTSSGAIRITYQDATTQTLRIAKSTDNGATWDLSALDSTDSTGYFSEQLIIGGSSYVGTWWRRGGGGSPNGVRVFVVE